MQGYCGRLAIVDLTYRHVDYVTVPDSVLQSFIGGVAWVPLFFIGMAGPLSRWRRRVPCACW